MQESEEHIFVTNEEVNANYLKLMNILFESDNNYFAIATHNSALIAEATGLARARIPSLSSRC